MADRGRRGEAGQAGASSLRRLFHWATVMALLIRAGALEEVSQPANMVTQIVYGLAYNAYGLLFVGIIVGRFREIQGWTVSGIALIFGLKLAAHATSTIPFGRLQVFDELVRDGEFDRFLIRPFGLLSQILVARFQVSTITDLVGGLAVLGYALGRTSVVIDWYTALVIVLVVFGGGLIESSCQLVVAGLAFRLLSTRALRFTVDRVFNVFAGYPTSIFPTVLAFVLTWIVPLAFVAYLPARELLTNSPMGRGVGVLGLGAPVVGAIMFALAFTFWRRQVSWYQGSGS